MDLFEENILGTVDVVIPVYKPGKEFLRLLDALNNQVLCPQKIILMVTRAEDYTLPDLSAYENVEIHTLSRSEFDHAGTRNRGLSYAESEYVLFMTQDAIPEGVSLISELVSGFSEDKSIVSSYARQLPKKDCRIIERLTRKFNYPETSHLQTFADTETKGIKAFFQSDVCCMYRREAFLSLGGFREPAIFNEDMIFAHDALKSGYTVKYNADAKVLHSHNLKLKESFQRNFDLGVSQADHPEVFELVSSEKEGGSMVKTVIKKLLKGGGWIMIPYFIFQCGAKFIGYKLGKKYQKLPKKFVKAFSSNKSYWEKVYREEK